MESVLHTFGYCLDFLCEQVADVAANEMVAQPAGVLNHPAWVIGHLTMSCQLLGMAIGMQPWLPESGDWARRFGTGSVPVAEVSAYESKEAALAALRDAGTRIVRAVGQLTDAELNRPFPEESYRDIFPTIRHALTQVLAGHTAYHIGQLAVWRRAMGLPGMTRSFE